MASKDQTNRVPLGAAEQPQGPERSRNEATEQPRFTGPKDFTQVATDIAFNTRFPWVCFRIGPIEYAISAADARGIAANLIQMADRVDAKAALLEPSEAPVSLQGFSGCVALDALTDEPSPERAPVLERSERSEPPKAPKANKERL